MKKSKAKVYYIDCIEGMRKLPDNCIDTIITDPPYNLKFMGKKWDSSGIAFQVEVWEEALRVMKPGAMLFAFGGTRTSHRLTCAIEDAGFEIRDKILWLYGSGFPKSHDISKAIQKASGVLPDKIEPASGVGFMQPDSSDWNVTKSKLTMPKLDGMAKQWKGQGTALKPAHEDIVLAMKPLDGTFAENALKWRVAGLNIDEGRIKAGIDHKRNCDREAVESHWRLNKSPRKAGKAHSQGRWPANCILSHHSECVFIPDKNQSLTRQLPYDILQKNNGGISWESEQSRISTTVNIAERKINLGEPESPQNSAIESVELPLSAQQKIAHADTNKTGISCLDGQLVGEQKEKESTNTFLSTDICGKKNTDQFPKDVSFTTKTKIEKTTDLKTSNSCQEDSTTVSTKKENQRKNESGKWQCHPDCPVRMLDEQSGELKSGGGIKNPVGRKGLGWKCSSNWRDSGYQEPSASGASRFFYCAKVSKRERGEGNTHPTVKPIKLLEYLCKLSRPPKETGGIVLDMFVGSGSTALACLNTKRNFIGFDNNKGYVEIARKRISACLQAIAR